MRIELELSAVLEEQLKEVVLKATKEAFTMESISYSSSKEWMNIKEGASYAGVSYNTFLKFRLMGLKFTEIDGVKRVSRRDIDEFLRVNSF